MLHRDSLGTEQVIRPGQLNLMTAGRGVSHAEEATGHYRGTLQGIQLWVAQPDATRHGEPAFEHHAELPRAEVDGAVATVLVGEFGGASLARPGTTPRWSASTWRCTGRPLCRCAPDFEYAVVVLEGAVAVDGQPLAARASSPTSGRGRDELRAGRRASRPGRCCSAASRSSEPIVMWWNFVARSRGEIDAAYGRGETRTTGSDVCAPRSR